MLHPGVGVVRACRPVGHPAAQVRDESGKVPRGAAAQESSRWRSAGADEKGVRKGRLQNGVFASEDGECAVKGWGPI